MQFNGETVRGCPFMCRVTDTSRVSLTLRHLELVPVGKPSAFSISVDGGGSAELTVTVRSEFDNLYQPFKDQILFFVDIRDIN